MDDIDFLDSIRTDKSYKAEASDFLDVLKTAGAAGDLAKKGLDFVSKNKIPLLGAAIGTATATALQYLDNKPKKDGKPSSQRQVAEGGLAASEKKLESQREQGKAPGFVDSMAHERAKFRAGASQVMEKHPIRGAALAAPMGAAAGYGLGVLGKKLVGG